MNFSEIVDFLNGRTMEFQTMKLGLDRIQNALNELGNPEKDLKVVHIAGSNGKGSVAAMLSSVLGEAGFRIGLYTSPHLVDIRERIRINGEMISESDMEKHYGRISGYGLTYFETLTAIAFQYFREKEVDLAVVEVGLGGRLDATNVVDPLVSVITSISLEHQDYLGRTIEEIAKEKAGIIKKGRSLVLHERNQAYDLLLNRAKEMNNRIYVAGDNRRYELSLRGRFQAENSGIVLKTLNALNDLGFRTGEKNVRKGLANTVWPGRLEIVSERPLTILDCAHNPAGILALKDSLEDFDYRNLILVFGTLKDKDYKAMIREFSGKCRLMILTKPNSKRALDPSEIGRGMIIEDPKKALAHALRAANADDLVLVTGSSYLIGDLKV